MNDPVTPPKPSATPGETDPSPSEKERPESEKTTQTAPAGAPGEGLTPAGAPGEGQPPAGDSALEEATADGAASEGRSPAADSSLEGATADGAASEGRPPAGDAVGEDAPADGAASGGETTAGDVAPGTSPGVVIVESGAKTNATSVLIDETLGVLSGKNPEALAQAIEVRSTAELAGLMEGLSLPERKAVVEAASPAVIGDVLSQMHIAERISIVKTLDLETLANSVCALKPTQAAEFLDSLPNSKADEIRDSLDPLSRERLEATLQWDVGTVGRLMQVEAVAVRASVTLATVGRYLRFRKSIPARTEGLMVVDRGGLYLGRLSFAAILTSDPETTVEAVMDRGAVAVSARLSEDEVIKVFERRDLLSVAVVDDAGALVGYLSVEDILGVMRAKADQQLLRLSGLKKDDDTFGPVWPAAKNRGVWLGINLLTAFLASWVIGLFQNALDQIVALAVLMPIVSSMGGITGSQTLALVMRGLSLGTLTSRNAGRLAVKEFTVGVMNGVVWAMLVAVVAVLWFDSYALGGIIAVALIVNMAAAALAGWGLPLLLTRLGQDPAISGSVLLTTVTDVVGFFCFLGLATWLLL